MACVNRRAFLGTVATAPFAAPVSIIDTHIHLFDTTRPEGVPWPPKDNATLFRPAMPDRYKQIAQPLGIKGAIVVEASPWLEDNQWVLDVAAKDPIIVGVVGNLEPGKPDFGKQLERFHRNSLFRGIRYGNLWGRNLAAEVPKKEFQQDLKLLSKAGLTLDTANPNPDLLRAVLRVTDLVPDLRIVIDHLPQMQAEASHLKEFAKRPQVFVKISEVFRKIDGQIPTDLSVYRGKLDEIFSVFGEDRVLYGSDWPNSDNWKPYADGLRLVQSYFAAKGQVASEKYFAGNSIKAYKWTNRK
jgi:L-fuconolactonase